MNTPRPESDRSPCLSRLNFRPFHPQPPHNHFATIDFARYIIVVTCPCLSLDGLNESVGPTSHGQGFAVCQRTHRQVRPNQVHFRYGLVVLLRMLSTSTHVNAVTFGFRRVTLAWRGLAPHCSIAFTGALALSLRDRKAVAQPNENVAEGIHLIKAIS
jgi:hypothetical protein